MLQSPPSSNPNDQSKAESADKAALNAFRGLVIDGVHKAQSGHPGGPLSSMDLAYILFKEFLNFDPEDPNWLGRDRFVLSAGHMSMLQYVMLHGIGWLTMEDLKNFRQWHSKTPGHPENFVTPGVECTTGPLGQGCGMSVGFAIAALHHQAQLDYYLFQQKIWTICSDGDLQEGVALGSASLAGHLKLDNLIWIYDKNHVQLSGPTKKVISDNDASVFGGFGWNVITIDGHNLEQIREAYKSALIYRGKPTLIIANTVIGKGCATMEDSYKTHGSPLPADERAKTKAKLGLPIDRDFYLPQEVTAHFRTRFDQLRKDAEAWRHSLKKKLEDDRHFQSQWRARFDINHIKKLSKIGWDRTKEIPTRNAFGDIIKAWAFELPNLIGGSADLEPSNMTGAFAKAVGDFDGDCRIGRNINFGVREFPMSSITNGMALFGGLIPFDATFLSFADYSRGALRLGSLQKARVIHEFTHDSFYLGEDGPTHQPIEQTMSLRAIPGLYVMRPADPQETEVLMRKALELKQPSAFCLTRQKVPYLPNELSVIEFANHGAYAILDGALGAPLDLIIIATGSEVSLALGAAAKLTQFNIRVVSMPCSELFDEQDASYRERVLPSSVKNRVSIEAGTTLGWHKYIGLNGLAIGIDHFGTSAPAEKLAEEYGFTVEAVVRKIISHKFD